MCLSTRITLTLALFSVFATQVASASSLQAYAFSVAGQSGQTVHGPTAYFSNNFPGGSPGGVAPAYDPTVAPYSSEQIQSGALGPLTASSAVSGSGNSAWGPWSNTSSSSATANYGQLSVYATTSAVGGGDNNSLQGSQAFASARDTFTIMGGSGAGVFRPTFTVSGSWINNATQLQMSFGYQLNNDPYIRTYLMQGGNNATLYYQGYVNTLPGLTVAVGSVTGTTQISFDVPFTFGSALDLTTVLYGAAVPSALGTTGGTVDFTSGATMTGISILQGGIPLSNFSIESASGTVYTAYGVLPEPGKGLLTMTGTLTLFGLAGRRRARTY